MDYGEIEEELKQFLQQKLEETGAEGYVVGVSGGIDSATTLKLAVEAVGVEKVNAWIMPGSPSRESNMEDARELASELGVKTREVNIEPVVEKFLDNLEFEPGEAATGNLRARVRMAYEYIDSNENSTLVLGSGNRSEYLLGYFTKYGDAAADLHLLLDLYKTEVRELAEHIGLDSKFIEKEPTAGLWEGQTDRDELGTGYKVADRVLERLVDRKMSEKEVADDTGIEMEKVEHISEIYVGSGHKRGMPDYPEVLR